MKWPENANKSNQVLNYIKSVPICDNVFEHGKGDFNLIIRCNSYNQL